MDRIPKKLSKLGGPVSFAAKVHVENIKRRLERTLKDREECKHLKGKLMKIKFDRFENTKTNPNQSGKTFPIIRVYGTALEGKMQGQDWNTQFFANARDMVSQVKSFTKGDHVNVRMEKNGQFWNPKAFELADGPASVPVQNATQVSNGLNTACSCVDNSRLENLKVAVKVLGKRAAKQSPVEYIIEAGGVADLVQDYIDKKGAFQFDKATSEGIPEMDDAEDVDGASV